MTTVLIVDLLKGTPTLRIESDAELFSIGIARPLEDAYCGSHHDLVGWIAELTGLDALDVYQLLSQAGRAPIGNVVDERYTIAAAVAKIHLPAPHVAYGGAHAGLRQAAGASR